MIRKDSVLLRGVLEHVDSPGRLGCVPGLLTLFEAGDLSLIDTLSRRVDCSVRRPFRLKGESLNDRGLLCTILSMGTSVTMRTRGTPLDPFSIDVALTNPGDDEVQVPARNNGVHEDISLTATLKQVRLRFCRREALITHGKQFPDAQRAVAPRFRLSMDLRQAFSEYQGTPR